MPSPSEVRTYSNHWVARDFIHSPNCLRHGHQTCQANISLAGLPFPFLVKICKDHIIREALQKMNRCLFKSHHLHLHSQVTAANFSWLLLWVCYMFPLQTSTTSTSPKQDCLPSFWAFKDPPKGTCIAGFLRFESPTSGKFHQITQINRPLVSSHAFGVWLSPTLGQPKFPGDF